MEGVILESAESPLEATSTFNKKIFDKRFESEKNSTENKIEISQNRNKTSEVYEKEKIIIKDMHISNIPESSQWGTEMSVLFGVIGVILLGKLQLLILLIFTCFGHSSLKHTVVCMQLFEILYSHSATIIIKHESDSESNEQSICDCFPKRSNNGRKRFDMKGSNSGYPSHFTSGRGVISEDYYASFASQRDTIVKLKNLPISTAGETLPFLQHY